ncbi:MAG: hypothetical protein JKY10_04975 [Cohaesibacteraceae bacterium]|nr:hypothetical protein [Cohaesibacteraceae bacterium]
MWEGTGLDVGLDSNAAMPMRRIMQASQTVGRMIYPAIAHRLSTVRHADRILVMDQGQIKPGKIAYAMHVVQRLFCSGIGIVANKGSVA